MGRINVVDLHKFATTNKYIQKLHKKPKFDSVIDRNHEIFLN